MESKINFIYKILSIFIFIFPFFLIISFSFFLISFYILSLNFSFFFSWRIYISSFYVTFPLYFDYISCIFLAIVLLIRGSIIFYSHFYIEREIYKSRFFYLIFLFVISIIFLILCPNFFCILLGWDGLGLISYCLVIYYQNLKSYSSGIITALTNRVGDVFILGTIAIYFSFGRWNYINFVFSINLTWFNLFFFIASLTKSAQIPFSAWLPAAMAAPTPVSSLVHSSTLVTAGVYILIRFDYFFSEYLKFWLMFISLLTIIISGISGLFEYDLKKIIALSTLRQLGFIISTIRMGYSNLAFFHLITHARFKALLFICAGIFIHYFFDNQDIRSFGLMNKNFSFSLSIFSVANLSLCGFPFLSGFFSKDLILELFLMKKVGLIFFFLIFLGTFLTVFYTFRLIFFLRFKNAFFVPLENLNNKIAIEFSIFFLFLFSVFLGYFGSIYFFLPYNYIIIPLNLKLFISILCLISFFFCYLFCKNFYLFKRTLILFLAQIWFLHFLKTDIFKKYFFSFSLNTTKNLSGFTEYFLGVFSYTKVFSFSYFLNRFIKRIFFYFFILFLFFLLFTFFLFF